MPGKSQIADRIAARGWSRSTAGTAVDAVLDEITAALAAGERVTLTGFGTFEAAPRAARSARNPRTGESIAVAATTVARFHPGATLRARVADGVAPTPAPLSPVDPPALALAAPVVDAAAAQAQKPAKAASAAKAEVADSSAKKAAKQAAKLAEARKAAEKSAKKAAKKAAEKAKAKAAERAAAEKSKAKAAKKKAAEKAKAKSSKRGKK